MLQLNLSALATSSKNGLKQNDVIHLLAGGENLEPAIVALGAMHLGIVPTFSDATLSDGALLVQVVSYSNF